MKKVLYIVTTLLEAVLLAGTYIFNYFTVKKLGMNRWVNFRVMKWEKLYPIPMIKMIVVAVLVFLIVLLVCLYMKKKSSLKKFSGIMILATVVLTVVSVGYILFYSAMSMRAYYFLSIMLAAAALLQIIKTLVGIMVCKNEK